MSQDESCDRALSRRALLGRLALAAPLTSSILAKARVNVPRALDDGGPIARSVADEFRLVPLPTRIYKSVDASREQTESWILWLLVESDRQRDVAASALRITLRSKGQVVQATTVTGAGLDAIVLRLGLTPTRADGSAAPPSTVWHLRLRVRCSVPIASAVDEMLVDLDMTSGAATVRASGAFPVEDYHQRTALVFPFNGPAIITQAGITNGGHTNRSGQFALDVVGLSKTYSIYLPDIPDSRSDSYAGWGRTLLAPAAGAIVRARNDRPDQPDPEKSDPKYYAPEYPGGGDPGNHLVIDHGNGEFSMLAHFQAGSMLVTLGNHVEQGQPLGKLGSSGDTVTPHVHYQLQSGPDHANSDGLPCRFTNVSASRLVRGVFFDAR